MRRSSARFRCSSDPMAAFGKLGRCSTSRVSGDRKGTCPRAGRGTHTWSVGAWPRDRGCYVVGARCRTVCRPVVGTVRVTAALAQPQVGGGRVAGGSEAGAPAAARTGGQSQKPLGQKRRLSLAVRGFFCGLLYVETFVLCVGHRLRHRVRRVTKSRTLWLAHTRAASLR